MGILGLGMGMVALVAVVGIGGWVLVTVLAEAHEEELEESDAL